LVSWSCHARRETSSIFSASRRFPPAILPRRIEALTVLAMRPKMIVAPKSEFSC